MTALDPRALEAAWAAAAIALREHVGNDMGLVARTALMQVVVEAALPAYLSTLPAAPTTGSVGERMPSREWLRDKIASDPDLENDAAVPAPPVQEPVAWIFEIAGARLYENGRDQPQTGWTNWETRLSFTAPNAGEAMRNVRPLYASPPLTEVEQAVDWPDLDTIATFAPDAKAGSSQSTGGQDLAFIIGKVAEAIRAATSAEAPEGVRVRKLEWESIDTTSEWATVREFWWCYRISLRADRLKQLRLEWLVNRNDDLGLFPDWDAAKAAAQADYETRIKSALDLPHPQETKP